MRARGQKDKKEKKEEEKDKKEKKKDKKKKKDDKGMGLQLLFGGKGELFVHTNNMNNYSFTCTVHG